MIISHKGITHERSEDAPFMGALISATDCKFGCKGCINNHLKKQPVIRQEASEIIKEILSNPFNEGIIFGGLEWSLQPLELLTLCNLAAKAKLKIMIYTGCEMGEFFYRLGSAVAKSTQYDEYVSAVSMGDTSPILELIGKMAIDNIIPEDYYIKVGLFDKEQKTTDNNPFGVHLASKNQTIIMIKGVNEDA